MEYTILDQASLSAEAQRALSSGPGKMMAARGMAPLANPVDLLSVLYQICVDPDAKLAAAAQASAKALPEKILVSALADPKLDGRVIDYFVSKADCRSALIDTVVLNQGAADETIAVLAATANSHQVDLIAENSQRVLRHPEIIAALYVNKHARMSTVDRVVELAVRNHVKVPGIAAWEEVCAAVTQAAKEESTMDSASMDALFEQTAPTSDDDDDAVEPVQVEQQEMQIRDMTVPMKIRLAMMGNKFQRAQLIKDPKKIVALAVIKSPSVKEAEAAKYASSNALCEEVIGFIANKKDWTKLYNIKQSLVANPKCPLPAAMRLLPHLRPKDLQALARSRNVPSALAAQAKKLTAARGSSRK